MPQAPRVQLTICSTCVDTNEVGESGLGGGGRLHRLVEAQLPEHPFAARIDLQPIRCLMACTRGCVASVAARGKMHYLLTEMPADEAMAEQILDFAAMYDTAPTGVTANHEWPPRIAMHLSARIPPADPVDADWSDDGCNL